MYPGYRIPTLPPSNLVFGSQIPISILSDGHKAGTVICLRHWRPSRNAWLDLVSLTDYKPFAAPSTWRQKLSHCCWTIDHWRILTDSYYSDIAVRPSINHLTMAVPDYFTIHMKLNIGSRERVFSFGMTDCRGMPSNTYGARTGFLLRINVWRGAVQTQKYLDPYFTVGTWNPSTRTSNIWIVLVHVSSADSLQCSKWQVVF